MNHTEHDKYDTSIRVIGNKTVGHDLSFITLEISTGPYNDRLEGRATFVVEPLVATTTPVATKEPCTLDEVAGDQVVVGKVFSEDMEGVELNAVYKDCLFMGNLSHCDLDGTFINTQFLGTIDQTHLGGSFYGTIFEQDIKGSNINGTVSDTAFQGAWENVDVRGAQILASTFKVGLGVEVERITCLNVTWSGRAELAAKETDEATLNLHTHTTDELRNTAIEKIRTHRNPYRIMLVKLSHGIQQGDTTIIGGFKDEEWQRAAIAATGLRFDLAQDVHKNLDRITEGLLGSFSS